MHVLWPQYNCHSTEDQLRCEYQAKVEELRRTVKHPDIISLLKVKVAGVHTADIDSKYGYTFVYGNSDTELIRLCVYVSLCVYIYIYIYIYMCAYVCVYVCIYVQL